MVVLLEGKLFRGSLSLNGYLRIIVCHMLFHIVLICYPFPWLTEYCRNLHAGWQRSLETFVVVLWVYLKSINLIYQKMLHILQKRLT